MNGTVIGQGWTGIVSIRDGNVQKKFKNNIGKSRDYYNSQKQALTAIRDKIDRQPQCFPKLINADDNNYTITMENLKGYIPLTDYLTRSFPWGYEEMVQKNLEDCVNRLNIEVGYNHNDLHSDNAMVNPQTHDTRIIDFSHASKTGYWMSNEAEVISWIFWAFHMYQVQAVMLLIWCIIGCVMLARPFRFKKWEVIIALTLIVCVYIAKYVLPLALSLARVNVDFNNSILFKLTRDLWPVFLFLFVILMVIDMPTKTVVRTTIINSIILFITLGSLLYELNKDMGRALCLQDALCLVGIIVLVIILCMTRVSKVIKTSKYTVSILMMVAIAVWVSGPRFEEKNIMDYIIVFAEVSPLIYMWMSLKYSEWVNNKWFVIVLMILPVFLFCGGINLRHRKLTNPLQASL